MFFAFFTQAEWELRAQLLLEIESAFKDRVGSTAAWLVNLGDVDDADTDHSGIERWLEIVSDTLDAADPLRLPVFVEKDAHVEEPCVLGGLCLAQLSLLFKTSPTLSTLLAAADTSQRPRLQRAQTPRQHAWRLLV